LLGKFARPPGSLPPSSSIPHRMGGQIPSIGGTTLHASQLLCWHASTYHPDCSW
jgi:hypothetical protein